jgi:hypothetical protein
VQEPCERNACFEPGEVHADADVGAAGKGDLASGVSAKDVEARRVGEDGRVAIGAGDRDADEVAASDFRFADAHVAGGVAIDDSGGGLEPQRLLYRIRQHLAVGLDDRVLIGVGQEVHDGIGDHPLSGLDAPEEEYCRVGGHLGTREAAAGLAGGGEQRRAVIAIECLGDALAQASGGRGAGGRSRLAGRDRTHARDDGVVPAQDCPGLDVLEAEHGCDHGRGERAGEATAKLGATIGHRIDEPIDFRRDERREPVVDGVAAERRRERVAMAGVRATVGGEHAAADDPAGGEARIIDGERRRIAQDTQRQVMAGHEPAVERRQPGDGFACAQLGEARVRIRRQIGEGDSGADGVAIRADRGHRSRAAGAPDFDVHAQKVDSRGPRDADR